MSRRDAGLAAFGSGRFLMALFDYEYKLFCMAKLVESSNLSQSISHLLLQSGF